ncbi:MAG: serine/threonine protein kinase, partial [Acidobacteria bacterium]|nr:serine/threonine protein kinase [Acidobacteriota bacterium]
MLAAEEASEGFLDRPAGPEAMAAEDLRGRSLGPYRLLCPIGRGGMSTVYLAIRGDDEYRQRVAVKVLRRGVEQEARHRLRTERQILAALEHPYIARLYFGDTTEDGLPFFAMEYVDGLRLDEYCRQHQLSVGERLDLFDKICSAVAYAHRNLVVHRDLKPGNILVTGDGTPKLLDFGIAKLLNPELIPPDTTPTAPWLRHLTPAYASPEQVRGASVSTASDVYSLGVLLYELLTGMVPIPVADLSPARIEQAVLEREPCRPSSTVTDDSSLDVALGWSSDLPPRTIRRRRRELRRLLAGDLDHILLKALRKEPGRRYSSVERLQEDLRRHQRGEAVRARRGNFRYRAGRFLKRHRWKAAALAIFCLTLLGFALAMASQAGRIRRQAQEIARERDEARQEADKRQRVLSFMERVFGRVGQIESKGQEVRAAEMLDVGLEMLEDSREEPDVRADLLVALGRNLAELRRFGQAAGVFREAYALRRQIFGEDSLEAADVLRELGATSYHMARYQDAERQTAKALEVLERH